jgi:hypothetical protein
MLIIEKHKFNNNENELTSMLIQLTSYAHKMLESQID